MEYRIVTLVVDDRIDKLAIWPVLCRINVENQEISRLKQFPNIRGSGFVYSSLVEVLRF
jgi:hypothetical protein